MTSSFGIIACHHTRKKSGPRYYLDTKSDFYPDFCCYKLKLKWSSMKFDSRQLPTMNFNLSTQTVNPTNTNSPTSCGKPRLPILRSPLSICASSSYPLCNLTPKDKRPRTRPILYRSMPYPTTSRSKTPFGTVSTPPLITPADIPKSTLQVLTQILTTRPPETSSLHPQPQNSEFPITAFVALTFVIVIPGSQAARNSPNTQQYYSLEPKV